MIHKPRIDPSSFYHFGTKMPRGMRHPVVNAAHFEAATRKYELGRRMDEQEDLCFGCWIADSNGIHRDGKWHLPWEMGAAGLMCFSAPWPPISSLAAVS